MSDLRAANERLLSIGSLGRRPQPSPVDLMREALNEPDEPAAPPEPAFVAAPAMPLEEAPSFVVKPSAGRAGRRAMDDLREQALRHVIASAQVGAAAPKRPGRLAGNLTPSRIIILAVALITGGLAAYLATQLDEPAPAPEVLTEIIQPATRQVLVAKDAISVGQRVTADALTWVEWPEQSVQPGFLTQDIAPEAATEMAGAVARYEFFPGEPILEQKLASPDGGYLASLLEPGMRGVSVSVNAAAASGGFVSPNDRVDVVSTRVTDEEQISETILRNVRVIAINGKLKSEAAAADNPDAAGSPEVFSDNALATLELDAIQTELIVNAMAQGQLTLVLRSTADAAEAGRAEQRSTNQAIRLSSPFWTK